MWYQIVDWTRRRPSTHWSNQTSRMSRNSNFKNHNDWLSTNDNRVPIQILFQFECGTGSFSCCDVTRASNNSIVLQQWAITFITFFFCYILSILLSVLQMMIKVLACLSYATTYYETEYYLCSQCRVVVGTYRKKKSPNSKPHLKQHSSN